MTPYLLAWAHGAFTAAVVIFFVLYALRPGTVSELRKKIRRLQTQLDSANDIIKRMDACTDRLGAKSCINPPEDLERAVEAAVEERTEAKQRIAELEASQYRLRRLLWCIARANEEHKIVLPSTKVDEFNKQRAVLTTLPNKADRTLTVYALLDGEEQA